MEQNDYSLRKPNEAKRELLTSMFYDTLNYIENNGGDKATLDRVRDAIFILDGWEEIYLNMAFHMGVAIVEPNMPKGLLGHNYAKDFYHELKK
jgi:hypothetical protein